MSSLTWEAALRTGEITFDCTARHIATWFIEATLVRRPGSTLTFCVLNRALAKVRTDRIQPIALIQARNVSTRSQRLRYDKTSWADGDFEYVKDRNDKSVD